MVGRILIKICLFAIAMLTSAITSAGNPSAYSSQNSSLSEWVAPVNSFNNSAVYFYTLSGLTDSRNYTRSFYSFNFQCFLNSKHFSDFQKLRTTEATAILLESPVSKLLGNPQKNSDREDSSHHFFIK